MSTRRSSSIERRRLGIELRRLRTAARLTLEEVARHFSWSVSKASRMERGLVPIVSRDIRDLAAFYGVTDTGQLEGLLTMTSGHRAQDWWHTYCDLLPPQFSVYLGFEYDASSIHTCEPLLIPGLLQTADYARALIRSGWPSRSDEDVERYVGARLRRQEILNRDDPPELSVILDEAAVRRRVGGPDVMRAQLNHLLTSETKPNITIQVVPYDAGAYMSMDGGFILLRFRELTTQTLSASIPSLAVSILTTPTRLGDISWPMKTYSHERRHPRTPPG